MLSGAARVAVGGIVRAIVVISRIMNGGLNLGGHIGDGERYQM